MKDRYALVFFVDFEDDLKLHPSPKIMLKGPINATTKILAFGSVS